MRLSRIRANVLVTGVLGALLLAACGSGQDAQTALTRPSIPGVDADAGDIQVRNAVVAFAPDGYAPGDDAPVELSISNTGREPVRLVGLASEGASSVTVVSTTQVGAASPSPSQPGGGDTVVVAPDELVAVTLQLTGLRLVLNGTTAVPVTLTFDNGMELPLAIPMDTPLAPQPRESAVVEQPSH